MGADSGTERKSFWRRHRGLLWTGVSALAVFALLTAAAVVLARRAEPYLRAQIVQSLADHLHARVELDTFHVGLAAGLNGGWGVVAQGRGLRIWPAHSTPSAPSAAAVPLIQVDEFNFHAPLRYQAGQPIVISLVRLNGLTIHIPPHSERLQAGVAAPPVQQRFGASALLARVVFDRIECDHAELVIETDKPGKLPLGFAIEKLHLTRIAASAPMNFEAQLTNPKPVGVIHATGSFGPWQADDPAASPVAGTYTFDHADLATFNGIAGILASTGRFSGTLRQIDTEGDADVPNFSLDRFASPEPLHTHFVARVDGTDGDTWLDSVNATLGSAHFITSGRIVRFKTALAAAGLPPASPESTPASTPASLFEGGHDIFLDIDIEHQPIRDLLRFTSQQQRPLLTGILTVKAKLHIPPGKEKVQQKLILDGAFELEQAQFTSDKIQSKVDELSLRAQGKPGEAKKKQSDDVNSHMQSNFHVANAIVTLPDLDYQVPGADIQLKGNYGLDGALSFQGTARMDATVSEMLGGWKGFLLKPADRFFKKDGAGTLIPIHVAGTREAPRFGVDFGRLKGGGTHPENPEHPDNPATHPASPVQPETPSPQR